MGENSCELNVPPFLGLHPVFNVDHLRPYFPPLLDTSNIAEQLTPTELNTNCTKQATTDQIKDTWIKHTHQQNIQLYRVVKVGQLLHQASGSLGTKFSKSFLISWRNSMQWGPLLPKGGGIIQVDIGGHLPSPLGPPPSFFQFFSFLNCSTVY